MSLKSSIIESEQQGPTPHAIHNIILRSTLASTRTTITVRRQACTAGVIESYTRAPSAPRLRSLYKHTHTHNTPNLGVNAHMHMRQRYAYVFASGCPGASRGSI